MSYDQNHPNSDNYSYHPGNENKSTEQLIQDSLNEIVNMEKRQNNHQMVLQRTIPAQADDSDILLSDTLHKALEFIRNNTPHY